MSSVYAVKNPKTGQVRFRIAIRKRGPKPFSHTELLPFGITKAEALERASQIESGYYRQVSGLVPAEYKLIDAALLYVNEHLARAKSESNMYALKAIEPFMGDLLVSQAVEVADEYTEAARDTLGHCEGTIKRNLGQLRAALRWLVQYKKIGTLDTALQIQVPSVDDTRVRFITQEPFEAAMQYEIDPTFRAFFRILFYSGLRRGELFRLVPSDIQNSAMSVHFGKSLAARRTVHIHPNIVQDLHMTVPFPGHAAGIYTKAWARLRATVPGLSDYNLHDLRHSFASNLLNNGVPLSTVSKLLGHSSVNVTLARYGHLSNDTLRDAVMMAGRVSSDTNLHTAKLEEV